MKLLRCIGITVSLLLAGARIYALQAVVSHAVFSHDGLRPYVEIYWQIDPTTLHYNRTDKNTWQTKIKTELEIKQDGNILKTERYLLETPSATSLADARNALIIEMQKYPLPQGSIVFTLALTDIADSSAKFIFIDSFKVVIAEGAFYSDIQLLDTAYVSNDKTVFKKKNKQQLPLCTNFLDENRKWLHYYAELYNTHKQAPESYPLKQRVYVSQTETDGPVYKLTKDDTIINAQMQVVEGDFNIESVSSGNYYLNVALVDKDNIVIAKKSLFFQRYNSKPRQDGSARHSANSDSAFQDVNVVDLSKSFVMKYNLEQIKDILKMLLPVSSPVNVQTIKGFLKNPDEGYMRYFVYNYFSSLNKKDPEEAWKMYANRIREVNKLFGTPSQTGYETDRGYVYLKYGAPDERVTVENERGSLPYEVWQYNNINKQYNNAVFLFYRSTDMINGFRLLHSTIPGEIRNSNWRTFLFPGGDNNRNLDSKAEQYLGKR